MVVIFDVLLTDIPFLMITLHAYFAYGLIYLCIQVFMNCYTSYTYVYENVIAWCTGKCRTFNNKIRIVCKNKKFSAWNVNSGKYYGFADFADSLSYVLVSTITKVTEKTILNIFNVLLTLSAKYKIIHEY